MQHNIQSIHAREILDSRGNPTLEATVVLESGIRASAAVPSGASTGRSEAHELRDQEVHRYHGQGVRKAVQHVSKDIADELRGIAVTEQRDLDERMIRLDGTEEKKRLGANAILGVSLACARAAARAKEMPLYEYIRELFATHDHVRGMKTLFALPQKIAASAERAPRLPFPMMNIFNGGKHADTNLDFQEFLIIPTASPRHDAHKTPLLPFTERARVGTEVFHTLGQVLREHGLDTDVGNEGGYAPDIDSSVMALDMIVEATKRAGYIPGKDVYLGMDVGAAVLYDLSKQGYMFKLDHTFLRRDALIQLYEDWVLRYPFLSIEDGLDEEDWEGWVELTKRLGKNVQLVGDDLFTTHADRLKKGTRMHAGNAILIKPNQVGTLTETLVTVAQAKKAGYRIVISHRSGETCDAFIADLAVGVEADFIKAGAPSRGERIAKYNRLMAIEEELYQ
ncbi:MAG: phosphopyruvate hydratase [Parcubacteria group bacterium CG08_land_8_20_14_0_20_48_21]|nr:MAG: phosphopyruvate hydratase [Parcubacteria group bacterium CG2_30_48_51]PIS33041.1 MAG: phosphopyruvate hydratase [Parcubacteria group bacterium CG08_land_8_20_14_0_20_48_21]PIW79118.1 MAG: phosphopyruvate hydratase [Parcubacteria group bacterium CG_4_8_14_3_um_filter_48_16]PIY78203.1 MAG: phosphopyruvate hydratase [Parcubacteria group bacterium CG_4_10_14_0_8_um_filter_48_154]PIZ78049.1 MAG: phosphopyruvate hydratase [bacterium CG_4_10_14_0_2_um_filter_48_144]PJC40087.1 MAG: phosphopyru